MLPKFILILLLFSISTAVKSQFLKRLRYDLGAGIGVSVGKSKLDTKESKINPFSVQYYRSERYKYPTFRVRGSAIYQLGSIVSLGVRSGADVIYFERNAYGQLETYFAIPIELISQIKAMGINEEKSLFIGFSIGYKSRKKYQSFSTRKGGLMASAELFLSPNRLNQSFYYKLGFEYAEENITYTFNPPPDYGFTNETMHMITSRKLLFVGIGYNF